MIETPTPEQYKAKHFDEETGEWLPSGSKEAHGVLEKYWAEKTPLVEEEEEEEEEKEPVNMVELAEKFMKEFTNDWEKKLKQYLKQ